MRTAMYIFVNKGLGMSTGKIAAQASHAAVEAYKLSKPQLIEEWYKGKHYTKLILEANSAAHLFQIERYIKDRGFQTAMIIDEGLTEIDAHQATALGIEVVDRDDEHTAATFQLFQLFKDKVKVIVELER